MGDFMEESGHRVTAGGQAGRARKHNTTNGPGQLIHQPPTGPPWFWHIEGSSHMAWQEAGLLPGSLDYHPSMPNQAAADSGPVP